MYQLKVTKENELDVYEFINLNQGSWLKVVPERGGIITGFGVEGEELLFLNEETLYDHSKNIRGGIPILFPISGQLENSEYEWNGKVYKMKNHGVARNNPWEVVQTKTEDSTATMTLRLVSNQQTKKEYPFEFEVIFTYIVTQNNLTIEQTYRNTSPAAMPIYAGFHPYFRTDIKNIPFQTDAKTYLDYNDRNVLDYVGSMDLADKKESLVLLDATQREISFELRDRKKTVILKYGDEFKYVVLWTEKGQELICVEPWMAKTDELNRKEELVIVEPGEALQTSLTISVK